LRLSPDRAALLGGSALLAGACFLPDLELEGRPCPCASGYTCDEATQTCHGDPTSTSTGTAGAPAGGGGAGAMNAGGEGGGGASAGGGGASTGGGGEGGGVVVTARPLILAGSIASSISLSVTGSFTIDADATTHWQFGRWFDTAADPAVDLAGEYPGTYSSFLLDTMQTEDAVHGWTSCDDGAVVDVELIDQTPVRVGLTSSTDYLLPNLRSATTYWVYANGRIAITSAMVNTSPSDPLQLLDSEYHYTTVSTDLGWSATAVDLSHSAVFLRTDGPEPASILQIVNFNPETGLYGDYANENRYWQSGAQSLAPMDSLRRTGALLLGPGGLDLGQLDQRSKDLRAPSLEIVSGAAPVGPGYDPSLGAYVVTASATTVELAVSADRKRFSPAFVVRGWDEASWSISLNGETLVADDLLVGHDALAYYDDAQNELVFLYLGDIEAGAFDAERIFTLQAGP
jgi:hypothetical protein